MDGAFEAEGHVGDSRPPPDLKPNSPRAPVMQQKTQRPVQFEITEQTRESLPAWIRTSRSSPFSSKRRTADFGLILSHLASVNIYA